MSPPYTATLTPDGRTIPGERECEQRYAAIRDHLSAHNPERPTVLDIGANTGYFGLRLAEDFEGTASLVDDRPELQAIDHALVIPRRLGVDELWGLERHDVVLALSVLHHFADWRAALDAMQACRAWCYVETPHPDERWMRSAAARDELPELHAEVARRGELIHESPRTGKDGSEWLRPMYALPGTVRTFAGEVFSGSGNNARSLDRFADETLTKVLGYEPFHGSLNLRVGDHFLANPQVEWRHRSAKRSYIAWRAWFEGEPGHVMLPTWCKTLHPDTLEGWAPVKLRDALKLADGSVVRVDVLDP